ncbi:MAG: hypothetical protein U9N61_12990 [Euryarchaeota archaeon]|nr:hypothetical protein [Euryarchaeota archaeon]
MTTLTKSGEDAHEFVAGWHSGASGWYREVRGGACAEGFCEVGLNNYLPVDWDEQTFKNTEMASKTRNNHKLVEMPILTNNMEQKEILYV